ncbi:hypothetical protein B0A48_08952 [Cryoendolithus antarcticus]|uniref:Uncharacterized protein n=1 Tax=Cryoendolithus antarcticus TaxID=1507870 RepID=A0A1V8T4L9_9PEZI|nr:hypothetical protein B0A48_08952 [Cryoendolithus antarcticus]
MKAANAELQHALESVSAFSKSMAFDFLTKLSISDRKKSASDGISPTFKRRASEGGIDNVMTKRMSISISASNGNGGGDSLTPSAPTSDHRVPFGFWPSKRNASASALAGRKDTKQPSLSEPEVEAQGKGKAIATSSPAMSEELRRKLEQLRLGTDPRQDNGEGSSRSQSKLPARTVPQSKQEYFRHKAPLPDVRLSLGQRASGVRRIDADTQIASVYDRIVAYAEHPGLPIASTDKERFLQSFSPTPVRSVLEPHGPAPTAVMQAGPSKRPSKVPVKQQTTQREPLRMSCAPVLAPVAIRAGPSKVPSLMSLTTDPSSRPSTEDESVFDIPEWMTIGTTPNKFTTSAPSSVKEKEIGVAK